MTRAFKESAEKQMNLFRLGRDKKGNYYIKHPYTGRLFNVGKPDQCVMFANSDLSEYSIILMKGDEPSKWITYVGPFTDEMRTVLNEGDGVKIKYLDVDGKPFTLQ